MESLRFPKSARLTRTSEFRKIKAEGQAYHGRFMVLSVLKGVPESRVGLITSRRLGNAVVRNRVRRRLRELARTTRPQLEPDCWLVLIGKRGASTAAFDSVREEWLRLARRASILKA